MTTEKPKGHTVIIDSDDWNSSTELRVNGSLIAKIRHNVPTPLDADQFAVLRDSNKDYRIVDAAVNAAAEATGGAGAAGASTASPEMPHAENTGGNEGPAKDEDGKKRAERPPEPGEAREIVEPPEPLESEAGANSGGNEGPASTGGDGEQIEKPKPLLDPPVKGEDTPEDAARRAEVEAGTARSREDATARRSDVKGAEDGAKGNEQDDGSLNGGRFSAKKVLEGSIAKITEDLDELTPRQVQSLLDHENKADKPRAGLIAALERKQASDQK